MGVLMMTQSTPRDPLEITEKYRLVTHYVWLRPLVICYTFKLVLMQFMK